MSKKTESSGKSDATETTGSTLAALAIYISEFVMNGTLDSRFAAKLLKHLKKEAEAISDNGVMTKLAEKDLEKAFDAVDTAIRSHDSNLLVAANASLRSADARKK